LDYATLSHVFGGLLGALHGALICESEGLRVDAFGAVLADLAPAIGGMVKHVCGVIQAAAYERPLSSVATCTAGFEGMLQQARDARINAEFPTFALALFRRAMAAGHGAEEAAAVIKVLRGGLGRRADSAGAAGGGRGGRAVSATSAPETDSERDGERGGVTPPPAKPNTSASL
jgi:hypothetical protein